MPNENETEATRSDALSAARDGYNVSPTLEVLCAYQ